MQKCETYNNGEAFKADYDKGMLILCPKNYCRCQKEGVKITREGITYRICEYNARPRDITERL